MQLHLKAGIAGSGVMGQLLAFSLINAGWDVTIFDNGIKNTCSMAAAGLLTPIAELEKNAQVIFQLGRDALEKHWPDILSAFKNTIYFRQHGSILLSHARDKADLTRFIKMITSKMGSDCYYQHINNDAICQLEPAITQFQEGYYFSQEGQIDNQTLLLQLQKYLISKKINWLKNTVVSSVRPGKIISHNQTYSFDLALDCRGLGAKENFTQLRSVRGELIWLKAPDVSITRPIRFLHPRYSLYLVPRPYNIFIIGASEVESDDHSPISLQTTLELLTAAYAMHPNLSEARIIKTMTQCRPTLPHHLPSIKYAEGFIAVNGLYRHGFLIAPTLANEVMRWIQEKEDLCYPQLWEKYV